jgi:hypothetical protein
LSSVRITAGMSSYNPSGVPAVELKLSDNTSFSSEARETVTAESPSCRRGRFIGDFFPSTVSAFSNALALPLEVRPFTLNLMDGWDVPIKRLRSETYNQLTTGSA